MYPKVGGRLRCLGSSQHLKTRFGNHLELEVLVTLIPHSFSNRTIYISFLHLYLQVKPVEVSCMDLENLCLLIQEKLFDIRPHSRSILNDIEVCIGGTNSIASEDASAAEISLSKETIMAVGQWFGNEERVKALVSATDDSCKIFGDQLSEQLDRDGTSAYILKFPPLHAFWILLFFFPLYILLVKKKINITLDCRCPRGMLSNETMLKEKSSVSGLSE